MRLIIELLFCLQSNDTNIKMTSSLKISLICFCFQDGHERPCDSLSLIDAVVPDFVENRRRELQQQQQQQQQSTTSSSSTSIKNENKTSSRPATGSNQTTSNLSTSNEKDVSHNPHLLNVSPQSNHPSISDRSTIDALSINTTSNGGTNYGQLFSCIYTFK